MKKKIEGLLVVAVIVIFFTYSLFDTNRRNQNLIDVELTFGMFAGGQWDVPNDDCYKIVEEAIEKFEKKYPNVTVKYVSGIQKDYYSEWISEQVLMDEIPDVMMVLPEDFDLFAEKGVLKNLNYYVQVDKDFDISRYYDGCYKAGTYGGSQYALPYESNPTLMFFNKTLLKEHEIKIDTENWTWDMFYEDCKKLSVDANKDDVLESYGACGYTWLDALYTNDGKLFDKKKKSSHFTSENVDQSISFAKKLMALSGYQSPPSEEFDLGNVGFATMKFSDFKTYKPYPYKMNKYKIFDWDCIGLPVAKKDKAKSYTNNLLMGMSNRTKNEKYAWEFLKMLCYDPEIQQEIYTYSQGVSVLRDVTKSDQTRKIFVDLLGNESDFDVEMLDDVMENSVPIEIVENYDYIMDYVDGVISKVILNQEDMDVALMKMKKRVDLYLQE